ncbi:PTS ascorbate transporter subunit IIC [Mediterraneibacter sp. NSJ-55]|uniref:Ascorbate-specific PTS system EIIC component n=1 Tax=Mediterraneibacter hominis TaxID=2763054 RepID=A0A923LLS4_9FIRM|nr:PTS transporter subunit IIC [Mediterraneibacter hominis]MBC5690574.1 PTS ascorbate transporter subunit IIC [Mediterraneibacter hominis]
MLDILNTCWTWFTTNIFTQTAQFMALLVLIGLLIAKKTWYEAVAGMLKAYIGYSVFNIASNGMTSTFRPILLGIRDAFNLNATVSDPYYGMATINATILPDLGRTASLTALAMLFGFLLSILLALLGKITKIRTLNVAGNCLNAFAIIQVCAIAMCCPWMSDMEVIIAGSIFTAVTNSVYSNCTVVAAQSLTDGAGMTVGHSQNLMDAFAYWLGDRMARKAEKKGKKIKYYDDLNLPGWLSIFNDIYVSAAIVMFAFFGIIIAAIGPDKLALIEGSGYTAGASFAMYLFTTTMKFPIYMVVLTTGLRMFVSELTVAFNYISEKVLHGTLPAVDCACFYGFVTNPNVLTAGFLIGSLTMISCTIIGAVAGIPFVLIMGFIPMFFDNATVACFAHCRGGIKCQVICNVITGIIDVFLGGLGCYIMGFTAYGGAGMNVDSAATFPVFGVMWKEMGWIGFGIIIVALLAIPQIMYFKNKETYWLAAHDWEKYKEIKYGNQAVD